MPCSECKDGDRFQGRLRIAIYKPDANAVAGESGHIDLTDDANWELAFSRLADRMVRSGGEVQVAQRTVGRVMHQFQVRYDRQTRGILPTWRVQAEGERFEIEAAYDPGGKYGHHKFIHINAVQPS